MAWGTFNINHGIFCQRILNICATFVDEIHVLIIETYFNSVEAHYKKQMLLYFG